MCEMILNWLVQQLRKENSNLQELCDYVSDEETRGVREGDGDARRLDASLVSEWRSNASRLCGYGREKRSFLFDHQSNGAFRRDDV